VALVAVLVGCYYVVEVRAAGLPFYFGYDLGGYYNYLGRAFAAGRLYLPIEPSPQLLAQPNPWDPSIDERYKMHDMALYNGRYYLYHGAGPAWLVFAPWRLIAKYDLPENAALPLFCFGGFLFLCGALLEVLNQANVSTDPFVTAAMIMALGLCQCVPYLLNRVWVYEVAIGAGFFCLSGAMYCLSRGVRPPGSAAWLRGAGLMFGLAIACRPHLALAGAIAFVAIALSGAGVRRLAAFLSPLTLVGAMVAIYNYERFGNPFEFGIRYLLSGPNQNRIQLSIRNVLPGLYHLLFSPPEFGAVFPWVRQIMHAWPPAPREYFLEPTVGALALAPFIAAAWLVSSTRRLAKPTRLVLWTATLSSTAILLFITATGFTTQRYTVDFLPLAVFAALANLGIYLDALNGVKRVMLTAATLSLIAYSVVANLALGLTGPYDDMVRNRPARYLQVASWFSPVERFRPVLLPSLAVEFKAEFHPQPDGFHEPLITFEHPAYRHFIYVEHGRERLRIISQSKTSTISCEIAEPGAKVIGVRVTYAPDSGKLTTFIDGEELLAHDIGTLVAAPAQVIVGENRIDPSVSVRQFTGRLTPPSRESARFW